VRQELDGIVYQECPQPSITRYDNTQLAQQYGYIQGDVISSSGHLRVAVGSQETIIEYIRVYLPGDEGIEVQNKQIASRYTISTP
jgi:hypothetical protein